MPQLVPGALAAPSTHACAPLVHDVIPAAHTLGFPVQDCPAVQGTQPPLPLQTRLAPQLVPAARLPKSSQTAAPLEQFVMPVLHGVGLPVQLPLAAHVAQMPAPLQTMPAPQLDPAALLPASAQVCAPVRHDVVPVLQGLGLLVHDCPALQATQTPPPSQTMPTPQLEPAERLAPSAHVVVLPAQVVVPCLHAVGLPVQLWPATQAPQKPLPSHIWPPVQVAVEGLGVPSVHTDVPVEQEVTPFRQIDGFVVQAAPAVHGT